MTITARTHTELMQIRDTMRDVLTEAAKHRHKREHVEGPGPHAELGWVIYEREQMTHAVNTARINRGLPALTVDDIRQVEQIAEGHAVLGLFVDLLLRMVRAQMALAAVLRLAGAAGREVVP